MTAPISLQGSISATLVSFEKTIKQYSEYLDKQKKNGLNEDLTKYETRLVALHKDHEEFSTKFKELKSQYNESNPRAQLFGSSSNFTENPFSEDSVMNKRNNIHSNTDSASYGRENSSSNTTLPMYQGLQKEQSIFERGNSQLDYILEMGQNSLQDIMDQNEILAKVQDKMTNSLRTLNVSEGTIQQINKRLFKDKLIFWIGLFLLFLGMYLVLKWLR